MTQGDEVRPAGNGLSGVPHRLRRRISVRPRREGAEATVTVVIPCFNYGVYLPVAVQSAVDQWGVLVNVVVVDDASTDDSLEVAHALATRLPNVRVIGHRENRGPVETFNTGLAAATGEFLVRLDADDALTPGSLRRSIDVMQAFPNVGLVYGRPHHFAGAEPPEPCVRPTRWTVYPGIDWLAERCRDGRNVITSPEVLMRRSVVDVVGGQRPLAHSHDMEMWLRIAAFSDVAYVHGCDQAWHREHSSSLSSRHVDNIRDYHERRDAFLELMTGVASAVPAVEGLCKQVWRNLALQALREGCHAYDRGRAEEGTIDALLEFAVTCDATVEGSAAWRALIRRRALGNDRVTKRPWYVARAAWRGVASRRAFRRWQREGTYMSARGWLWAQFGRRGPASAT